MCNGTLRCWQKQSLQITFYFCSLLHQTQKNEVTSQLPFTCSWLTQFTCRFLEFESSVTLQNIVWHSHLTQSCAHVRSTCRVIFFLIKKEERGRKAVQKRHKDFDSTDKILRANKLLNESDIWCQYFKIWPPIFKLRAVNKWICVRHQLNIHQIPVTSI